MCDFCKTIYTSSEAIKWKKDWWDWSTEQPDTIIVKGDNYFSLWNAVDDNFYTGKVMEIKYCPVCGKQL